MAPVGNKNAPTFACRMGVAVLPALPLIRTLYEDQNQKAFLMTVLLKSLVTKSAIQQRILSDINLKAAESVAYKVQSMLQRWLKELSKQRLKDPISVLHCKQHKIISNGRMVALLVTEDKWPRNARLAPWTCCMFLLV